LSSLSQLRPQMKTSNLSDQILQMLSAVAGTDEVCQNLDLLLYEEQLLDSMKTVELMVMIEEELGLRISPAEFERENWATPRKLRADLERRLTA
jgi:D-alanine--poly(phosphoribitol) ligase subunit 2